MRRRINRPRAALGLMLAFWAALILGGSVAAQEGDQVDLQLTPSRDSGVSGQATLTEVDGGVEVMLQMQGLPEAGVEHINHIHGGGTCAEDRAGRTAPVTIPLETVTASGDGTGSATTQLKDLTLAQLFDDGKDRFILLHAEAQEGQGVPPGIACADLVRTASRSEMEMLPESGGMDVTIVLAAAGAISILFGAALLSRTTRHSRNL